VLIFDNYSHAEARISERRLMAKLTVATEMPSGARSQGYDVEEEIALKWFESVLKQMKVFNIPGSFVLLLEGEKEISREAI
jgi:hypothetical protein